METKWSIAAWLLVLAGSATCYITCRDGKVCSDKSTCCLTEGGYECCPIPNAVCCPDMTHCCPSGFQCNAVTGMCERRDRPWSSFPMLKKVAAEEPSAPVSPPFQPDGSPDQSNALESSPVARVQCDSVWSCPDGTTCCLHPYGVWWCCPHSSGTCCLDGNHCCPFGYVCDMSFTKCLRKDNLREPFVPLQNPTQIKAMKFSQPADQVHDQQVPLTGLWPASSGPPEPGVIHCDAKFFCPPGNHCCQKPTGQWGCCPYPLGHCCADGIHCCQYGYTCDSTSSNCQKQYSQIPSSLKDDAKQY